MSPSAALNGVCPYFTMFPLSFPLNALRGSASAGDIVLDPFCGRGTTNYAARLLGLPSFGVDAAPVAVALSEAKLANLASGDVVAAAIEVLNDVPAAKEVPSAEFWIWAFDPHVLATVCRLREGLLADCASDRRKALRAVAMGALHGPSPRSRASYFSNQSPRTYAPKPSYAVRFWSTRGLKPRRVDVLEIVAERALRYYGHEETRGNGSIIQGDSRDLRTYHRLLGDRRVSWVITSPPDYGIRTYIPDQWLRHWFVGGPDRVDYSSADQLRHSSPRHYVEQLREVWRHVAAFCTPRARMILRFGSINDRREDGLTLAKGSLQDSGWEIDHINPAGTAARGRRQALHFSGPTRSALGEYDIWARLSRG